MSSATDRQERPGPDVDIDAVSAEMVERITQELEAAKVRASERLAATGFFSVRARRTLKH